MELKQIRKYLHIHPELSGEEVDTAGFVEKKLHELDIDTIHHNFSEHSLLAEINFGQPGKTILFRCELDALPIQEKNQFPHQSIKPVISHTCGHDGHITIILGLAEKLIKSEFSSGKVLLLFQSSEETGKGAKSILASKKLEEFSIDHVFALHNVPGYPVGSIICKSKAFTPSVESLDILLTGKISHAGMPEKGINPASAVAEIIQFFQSIHSTDTDKDHFLATPIQIQMGRSAYGASAGNALVSYTLRSWNHQFFLQQKERIIKKIDEIVTQTAGLKFAIEWKEAFDANYNSAEAYEMVKRASEENKYEFIKKEHPFTWGEDFGTFTQTYKGAMFGIGSGVNTPELHNPDYDFPDEILDKGISMFYSIAKQLLA